MRKKILSFILVILMICTITSGCGETNVAFSNGLDLLDEGKYYEAIPHFDAAAEFEDTYLINTYRLSAYYHSDRIFKCHDLALKMIDKYEENYLSKYYLAITYRLLNEPGKSIKLLEELLEQYPKGKDSKYKSQNEMILALANIYYYDLGDMEKAREYLLMYEPEEEQHAEAAQNLLKEIAKRKNMKGDTEYMKSLFDEYYMYDASFDSIGELSGDLSDEEIAEIFNMIKKEDDPFSFLIQGDRYDSLKKRVSGLQYKELDKNIHYINIESFTNIVNFEFLEAIDKISNPKKSTLIIDLRDNGGGSLYPTANILDHLIGKTELFNETSNGETIQVFESDDFSIKFKEIYVLLNKRSASASEVLALSLNTHLDNVTLVGEQTFGKGVGQRVFNDIKKKRLYCIVNFYWNVGETNIHQKGITPEVPLENDKIDEYMMKLLDLKEF